MLNTLDARTLLEKAIDVRLPLLRRAIFFVVVAATAVFGIALMSDILRGNGTTPLETAILVLFAVTFSWISVAFWTAVAGFVLQLLRLDPFSLRRRGPLLERTEPIVSRTALIMPVYNEEVERVIAGIEATCRDLQASGAGRHFDFYLLSDSTDPAIAAAEEQRIGELRRHFGSGVHLYYRRRADNEGRKVGNIAEFCRRWGRLYDYMIVLDADSVMTGETLVTLVRAMQNNPRAGIIQTVPIPVRQQSMFGRFLQFASALYSPMLATGLTFWQTTTANYWGHNAIIRVAPFMRHCGLPVLSGRPPLGGEILSHDFVEAALMRRGGWHVYLLPELGGSYEEVPGNLLDYAKRDRRWVEGNLQHLRLLAAEGLHPFSRLYFLMGALAYLCSFFWLLMLTASTIDALSRALTVEQFFGSGYQLFPDWPIAKPTETMSLLAIVICLLFAPKLMAIGLSLLDAARRRAFGGGWRLLLSALLELVFSVLVAPVMMMFHAFFVGSVLLGRHVIWNPQNRHARQVPWRMAFRHTIVLSVAALLWGWTTAVSAPTFFWALTPVLAGLLLAGPLIRVSSSTAFGRWLRERGMLLTPGETEPSAALRCLERRLESAWSPLGGAPVQRLRLPPELHADMPTQPLTGPANRGRPGSSWGWPSDGRPRATGLQQVPATQPAERHGSALGRPDAGALRPLSAGTRRPRRAPPGAR